MITKVCGTCDGARWVAVDDDTIPGHYKDDGSVCGLIPTKPCPACNVGPDYYPWNLRCLRCATMEEFMSTIEPDDPDAVLAGLFEQLDLDASDVTDFSKLSDVQISERFNEVRDRLNDLGEMHRDSQLNPKPSSPEGRELHSERAALLVEMSRRGMRA
jgi:hypothetical protein